MVAVGCWEILRYEVHLYVNGNDLGGNNYFGTEEEAFTYGRRYTKEYPEWSYEVKRVEVARGVEHEL